MFDLDIEGRLQAWSDLRKSTATSSNPLQDIVDFWREVPFTPHNHLIDPYYPASWPTPWEIIEQNKYDDFTRAVMIGYTVLLTDRFKNSNVQIRTLVDQAGKKLYNVVFVDDLWALNYQDNQVVEASKVPGLYNLENLVELKRPR